MASPSSHSGSRFKALAKKVAWAVLGLIVLGAGYLYLELHVPLGAAPSGERLKRIQASPHYRGGRFVNTLPTQVMRGTLAENWKLMTSTEQTRPFRALPVVTLGPDAAPALHGLRLTWLGHATFLIELDGSRILTDPVLGERASPLSWIGPRRFHPLPIAIANLPELDAVVISHDHYDHLDCASIQALLPKTRAFVVPLGIGSHLESWGVPLEKIVELDWWEETRLAGNVLLAATPARHYSGRFIQRDNTLWASWAVVGQTHRVWFGGDSGMSADEFQAVGNKYGPFNFALIKIGAYGKTWPDIHVNPEEALEVFRLVRAQVFVPAHWGTFNLSYHRWDEPIERLLSAARAAGVTVAAPKPGQTISPEYLPPPEPCWEEEN